MSDAPHIVIRPHSAISPEQARDIRASAWRYVFYCHGKHKAVGCDQHHDGDEAKGSEHEVRPTDIIQE